MLPAIKRLLVKKMKYAFIKALEQAKQSDTTWRDFRYRMANYLIKQPSLSERLGYQVNELASEYTLCPCGHGLVIVDVTPARYPWEQPKRQVRVCCKYCQGHFAAVQLKELRPTLAIQPDLAVELTAGDGQTVIVNPHPRGDWKMLSWRK